MSHPVSRTSAPGHPWDSVGSFILTGHHVDRYPPGDEHLGPERVARPVCTHSHARRIERCDRTLGQGRALVQVLMYGDLSSSRSATTYTAIRAAMDTSPGISLAHRHMLPPSEPGPRRAAEAAEAAAAQGAFWQMCDRLYRIGSDPSSIMDHCRSLGLDDQTVREWIVSRHSSARIDHDLELAIDCRVPSSPALFVNGVRWPTDDSDRDLRSDLEEIERRVRPLRY